MAASVDRVRYALETVGLLLTAAGSVVLAAVELGPWWFVVGVAVIAFIAVWVVAARKLRQLWLMRAASAHDYGADAALASESEQREIGLENARWSTCLRNAFAPTPSWPPASSAGAATTGTTGRFEPRELSELHERGSRLEEANIPPRIAPDVQALRAQEFSIKVDGDYVIATAPDGRSALVSRSGVAPNSVISVLTRQKWLSELKELDADIRPGVRGQLHVAGDIAWGLPDLA